MADRDIEAQADEILARLATGRTWVDVRDLNEEEEL